MIFVNNLKNWQLDLGVIKCDFTKIMIYYSNFLLDQIF